MAKVTIEIEEDQFGNVAMLRKLKPGEPWFIVRGQDRLAAGTVRFWANQAESIGAPDSKVASARRCAHAIREYTPKKIPD